MATKQIEKAFVPPSAEIRAKALGNVDDVGKSTEVFFEHNADVF